MADFILGCNYWASHAGTDMWRNWQKQIIENDLKILKANNIEYLRIFPNWRDFQPVVPFYSSKGSFYEYRLEGEIIPNNAYFLDENILNRFAEFCDIAEANGLKLIVGLITGWMSGRLFIPPALYGKNIFTDSSAQMLQLKFVRGFVENMKDKKSIFAWDLGNECNVMSETESREAAYVWSAMISNAVKAIDQTRPIISGMHTLSIWEPGEKNAWSIADQAETTDILTTHPYPFWVKHCSKDKISSIRTLLHATAETKYYSDIGGKNCLVEEIGTMGPMICDDETAAGFMRVNLYSNWANGATGLMWWCANDQSALKFPPYSWSMCERELGMLDANLTPKPMLEEMRIFADFKNSLDFELPPLKIDAVCILTKEQDHWGVAYAAYILAKQAGLNISFSYCDAPIPDSELYLMPSIEGTLVMPKERYDELKAKIHDGAKLYISIDNAFLTEFSKLTGVIVQDSEDMDKSEKIILDKKSLEIKRKRRYHIIPENAEVLYYDDSGIPALTKNNYGNGEVFYANFPLESYLINKENAFADNYYRIYKKFGADILKEKILNINNPFVGVTEHFADGRIFVVIINYSGEKQGIELSIAQNYIIKKIYSSGLLEINSIKDIEPYQAFILKIV